MPQPHAIFNLSSLIWLDDFAPAALASLLFDPPEPGKHWKKHGVLRYLRFFFLSAYLDLLSFDFVSSLIFFLLPFSSLTLPTFAGQCALIVGSLASIIAEQWKNMAMGQMLKKFRCLCHPQSITPLLVAIKPSNFACYYFRHTHTHLGYNMWIYLP